ncbi:MAG: PIN domain-containing protein [Actinomycetota bacterium]|jgi:predicted nucleic acid-binding protein|nr:PIN domain-containing protein [Actinomycetota bacterium]
MAIILDSSGLLSAIDDRQEDHIPVREFLESVREPLVISPFVLAELDYMVMTRLGQAREVALLREVARGAYILEPFSAEDVSDAIEVIENYADLGVGLADASNVVLSRRRETNDLLTLDERHFRTLRGYRERPFRVLPADA